ncbi:HNH endonuclease [Streptomyces sp. NPDC055722]
MRRLPRAARKNAKLQIDQIDQTVLRSWGGETELDNLEPLCQWCNNGEKTFPVALQLSRGPVRVGARRHRGAGVAARA